MPLHSPLLTLNVVKQEKKGHYVYSIRSIFFLPHSKA